MADSKSLIFVIKGDITNFNKAMGDAERQFKKSFGNIQKAANEMSMVMGGIGLAIVGSLGMAVNKFSQYSEDISNMAARTGMSTTAVQELGMVAQVSGSSIEGMETAIKFMQKSIDAASQGVKSSVEAFNRLGISISDIQSLSPDEQFKRISSAIAAIPDPAGRAAMAVELFGRSGTQILPMLENYEALITKLRSLGVIMDEAFIKKGAASKQQLEILGIQVNAFFMKLGESVNMTAFLDNISNIVANVMKWAEENPGLVKTLLDVAAGLLVAAAAFKAVAIGMAMVQSLSGPAGIIKTVAGVAAAGVASLAFEEMTHPGAIPAPVPKLAAGGIVNGPTLAMIGEAGPEAVVPLGNMGSQLTINVGNFMGDEMSLRQFTRKIESILGQESNRSRFAPSKTEYYSPGGHL